MSSSATAFRGCGVLSPILRCGRYDAGGDIMPMRSEYEHGTFSWADLGTNDAEGAKKFYGNLFGWAFVDVVAAAGTYTFCKLGAHDVCAIRSLGPATKSAPKSWLSYVTVANVDDTTKRAAANGGKIVKEPFDVTHAGRMSLVQDPPGATIAFWQPEKHVGAGLVNDPGSLTWNELFTHDVERAGRFYVEALGWTTEAVDHGPMAGFTLFKRGGENVGGMRRMPVSMKGVPPHWLAYFAVTDCDACASKARRLGGTTVAPPTDIPKIGRFSIVRDPQGATFGLFAMAH
jgi:predicted enzyme related to lactoylglutathione lyase